MIETPQQVLQNQVDAYNDILENLMTNKKKLAPDDFHELFNRVQGKIIKFKKAIELLNKHIQ